MAVAQAQKYLDPVALSRLGNMELIARCAVEGFFSGLHPSPFHGFSVEYSDHRAYRPGDELKFLDWKAFGRSDKLYIKRFQQETNVSAYILLDSSNSMSFTGENGLSKLDYGSFLAAALAYLMLGQSDSVALTLFGDKVHEYIPPRSRRTHLNLILSALQKNPPSGQTNLPGVLHHMAERTQRRGLVILISDLLDDTEALYNGLAHLKYLHHDIIIFHLLDHQELHLDYEGLVEFRDLESNDRLRTFPESLRQEYRSRVRQFVEELERSSGQRDIDYCLIDTSEPLNRALLSYLAKRRKLM